MKAKVTFLLPHLKVGGTERTMSLLAAGFAGRGLEVDFILVKAEGQFLSQLPRSVRVIDLNLTSSYYSLSGLIRYLRDERPQVFVSALDLTNLMALFSRRISGVPVNLAIRLDNTVSMQLRSRSKKKLERLLLSKYYPWADEIIAVSNFVAEDFSRYTGIPVDRVRTIYNPIILPDFDQRSREAVHHPWFADGQPPVILGAGRLVHPKNFELLIRAFKLVYLNTDTRLLILGEGQDRLKLENLIEELNLQQLISLPGNVPNPYAYMRRSAVFVLSSRTEGLPTVLVEAMACGCPVISTDCPGGSTEILNGEAYGLLTPVDDAAALADAILSVLRDGGRKAPSSWFRQFELGTVVDQYLDLLELG